jgi:pimeloyl-ACP methyl ester carboxylesterase
MVCFSAFEAWEHTMKKIFFCLKFALLGALLAMNANTFAASFTSKNNQIISYTDKDKGNGKPLVLIHPFPTDQNIWNIQTKELARRGFRVITIDLWGFGQSTGANGQAITMPEYAEEVKELLDYLHVEKAIIAGESMGGYITLAFLEKYPDKVLGLVLSGTQSIADTDEIKAKRELSAKNVLENGTSDFIANFSSKAFSPSVEHDKQTYLRFILERQSPEAIASALRGMALRKDTSYLLSQSTLPILIITGDQDNLISPQQSEQMHKLAKNSKLVILQNAGHLSNLEQPEYWIDAVVDMFLYSSGSFK